MVQREREGGQQRALRVASLSFYTSQSRLKNRGVIQITSEASRPAGVDVQIGGDI